MKEREKDLAAVMLGKRRAKAFTSEYQRRAAKARWEKLGPKERSRVLKKTRRKGIKKSPKKT